MSIPVTNSEKSCQCVRNIFEKIVSLNLFVSEETSRNKQTENEEMIATRIYILLFVLCIIVTLLYSGPFSDEKESIKIKLPTIDTLQDLHNKNISTLSCPCSRAAVRYSTFLSIKGEYDPICSSKYTSPSYILNLYKMNNSISFELSTHYRILSSLCHLSQHFIENTEKVFGTRELITVEALTRSSFDNQIKALVSTFISQTSADYRRTLSFVIDSFSVNQLLNLFTSNWKVEFSDGNEKYLIKTYPRRFSSSNCSCAISSDCTEQLTDDIHIGCFPYDGFRLSKFKNISLGKLNEQLFVRMWTNQSNYTNYYQKCKLLECQYTLPDKNNPSFILTTILGLYGSLTYILHTVVGQSLLAYQWWKNNRRQKQMQTISTESDII